MSQEDVRGTHRRGTFLRYNRKIEIIESLSALKNFIHLIQRLDVTIKQSKTVFII